MPTDEELKYFIALRDVIAGKMGLSEFGDKWLIYKAGNFIGTRTHETGTKILPQHIEADGYSVIRLPLDIDRDNPERGLVGMVRWLAWLAYYLTDETWAVEVRREGLLNNKNNKVFWGNTPTLALLKALAAQEGIEVT